MQVLHVVGMSSIIHNKTNDTLCVHTQQLYHNHNQRRPSTNLILNWTEQGQIVPQRELQNLH